MAANNQFTGEAPPLQPASYFNRDTPTEESNPFAFVSTNAPPMQGQSSFSQPSDGSSGFFDRLSEPRHSQESGTPSGPQSDGGYSSVFPGPTYSQETQPPSSHVVSHYSQALPHGIHPSHSFTEGVHSQPAYGGVRELHPVPVSAVESSFITQSSQGDTPNTGLTQPLQDHPVHGRQASLPPPTAASLFSADTHKDDFFSSTRVLQPSLSAPSTTVQAVLQPEPPVPTQESGPPSIANINQSPTSLSPVSSLPHRPPSNADSAPTVLDIVSERPLTNADFPPTGGLKMTNSMDSPPASLVGTPLPVTNDDIANIMNPAAASIKLVSPRSIPSGPALMPPHEHLDKSTSSLLDSSQEDFTSSSPIRLLPPAPSEKDPPSSQPTEPWNGSMKDWEIISEDTVRRTDPVLESNVIDQNSLSSQVAQLSMTTQSADVLPLGTVTSQPQVHNQQETVAIVEPRKNVLVPSQGFSSPRQLTSQGLPLTSPEIPPTVAPPSSQYAPEQSVQYQSVVQNPTQSTQSVSNVRFNLPQVADSHYLQGVPPQQPVSINTTINQLQSKQVEEHPPPQHHRAVEEHPPPQPLPQHHRAVEEHPLPQHHRAVEDHPLPQHHRAVEEHPLPQHHRAVEEHPPPQHHRAVEEHPQHQPVDYSYSEYYRGYPNERYRQPSDYYPPPHDPRSHAPKSHDPRAQDPRSHDPRYPHQPHPQGRHPYQEPYRRAGYSDHYQPQYRDQGYYERYEQSYQQSYPEEQYYENYEGGYYGNESYYGQEYEYDYNTPYDNTYSDQFQPIANQGEFNPAETSAIPGHANNFESGQTFIDSPQVQTGQVYPGYNQDGSYIEPYGGGYEYPDGGQRWEEPARQATPPPTPRQTPEHFAQPHTRASFGFGGQLVTVLPHLKRQGLTVEIVPLKDVVIDKETYTLEEAVNSFPGPFLPGSTPKNIVVQYINTEIRKIRDKMAGLAQESFELKYLQDEILLWQFLLLLCRQNGAVLPTDISDMLIGEQSYSVNSQLHLGTADKDHTLSALRDLLLSGQRKAALDLACAKCLWGHALMLADEQSRNYVVNRFTASLSSTDPLSTFYTLLLGQMPSAVKYDGLSRAGDWRPHLAMILSNKTSAVDTNAIISLGDSLLNQGRLFGAHLCYYLGNEQFGSYGEITSKYTILGLHQTVLAGTIYPDPRNLTKMEVFEFAMSLNKQEFSLPGFQMYKFLLVFKLLECGYVDKAVKYCEQISISVLKAPKNYTQVFLNTLVEISIKLHHLTSPYGVVENELPNWLSVLERCDLAASDSTPRLFSPSPAFSSVSQTFPRNNQAVANAMLGVPTSQYRTTPAANIESTDNGGAAISQQAGSELQGGESESTGVSELAQQWTGNHRPEQGNQFSSYQSNNIPQQETPPSEPPPALDTAPPPMGYWPQQTVPQQEPAYTLHPPSDYGHPVQSESTPQDVANQQPISTQQEIQPSYQFNPVNMYGGTGTSQPIGFGGSGFPGSNVGGSATPQPTSGTPQPVSHDQSHDTQVTKKEIKEPKVEKDKKGETGPEKKSSGWGMGIFSSIFPKRKNQAHLPRDKDKSIYYDEELKKWVNKDAPEEEEPPPPPPPSDSQLKPSQPASQVDGPGDHTPSAAPAVNQFSRAGAKRGHLGARSKYVDVMNPSGTASGSGPPPPAGMMGPPHMTPGQLPGSFFVPQLPPEENAQSSTQPSAASEQPATPATEQQSTDQVPQYNQAPVEHRTQYHQTEPNQPAQQHNLPQAQQQVPTPQPNQQQYYPQGAQGQQYHQPQSVSTPSSVSAQQTVDTQPTPQFFNPSAFAPVGNFPPQSNQQDDTMSTVSMMSEASQEVSSYMQGNKSTGFHQRMKQGPRGYPQVKQAPPTSNRQPQQQQTRTRPWQ